MSTRSYVKDQLNEVEARLQTNGVIINRTSVDYIDNAIVERYNLLKERLYLLNLIRKGLKK